VRTFSGWKALKTSTRSLRWGGPDGGKDILCEKRGLRYVAACHFPHGTIKYTSTRKKFRDDLALSLRHARDGFIFMTNQQLTPLQRAELEKEAAKQKKRCLVFHREHLRVVLDSPNGYGVRLRHLNIPLSTEEQFAYFATTNETTASAVAANTRAIERLTDRIERIGNAQMGLALKTTAVIIDAVRGDERDVDVGAMLQASAAEFTSQMSNSVDDAISARLTPALIRYIHRLTVPDPKFGGRYRETQVWLADPTGKIREDQECPSFDKVPVLIEELIEDWNRQYPELVEKKGEGAELAIAKFMHRLLIIHPFIDGNGRVAGAIAALQARELFGLSEDILLDKGVSYYRALKLADQGDLSELATLVETAIEDAY